MDSSKFKWCFVPHCDNNSRNAPNKLFITIPANESRKTCWFQSIQQSVPNTKTRYYCCEDHFNLKEDAINYMQYKLMGGRIFLKDNVVPHIFPSARNYKRRLETSTNLSESSQKKRQSIDHSPLPSTTTSGGSNLMINPKQNVGIQVKPHVRSKYISCHVTPNITNTASSPIKQRPNVRKLSEKRFTEISHSQSDIPSTSEEEKEPSSFEQTDIELKVLEKKEEQTLALKVILKCIENNPKRYIGVPKKWYNILLDLLCKHSNLKKEHILLCLMKIKTNDTLARLGDQFGISSSTASKIFKTNILIIGHLLKPLVYWPDEKLIKKNLPIPFRARYSSVQSIIDCLEIEIEKPSNPMRQSLTWSEYKKCNTFKYLISCTPDGFINFVSNGFGGRISDVLLLEQCNYLNILPHDCAVMADRGFKHVDNLLLEKNCKLIKPPSVSSSTKPTKAEVIESKRIASLRIHVERLIRRLREFAFLKPHSVINHQLLPYTDIVIYIACALINLQSPVIKSM